MQYVATVKQVDAKGQTFIKQRTVIYADTELEAKVQAASMFGIDPDALTVTVLGDTGLASNSQIVGRQQE